MSVAVARWDAGARAGLVGRVAGLLAAAAALALAALLSLAVGSRSIPLREVVDAVFAGGDSQNASVVLDLRVPRTLLGAVVGVGLGLAGALMQALTRNPLADPGLLGVNAGAAAAVVTAIGLLGITSPTGFVWFAFAGAAVASVVVYVIGSLGRGGSTPVRLALAGMALTAALVAYVYAVALTDPLLLQRYNLWAVGTLADRGMEMVRLAAPFVAAGALMAFGLARALNALALGEDAARALGAHAGRTRVVAAAAVTLLCGAATAAAGPISFVGLTVPHVARAITGPDERWVMAYSVVLAPTLLLLADVLGRVAARPGEVQVGIVLAFVGVPVFIALVRRRRIAGL
jgi:iron complex transport system permease protein